MQQGFRSIPKQYENIRVIQIPISIVLLIHFPQTIPQKKTNSYLGKPSRNYLPWRIYFVSWWYEDSMESVRVG